MKKIFLLFLWCVSVKSENTAVNQLTAGNNLFAADLYSEIIKNDNKNIFISPFSLETVLALTAEGAEGETAKEFQSALHLPKTEEQTQSAFKSILKNFNKQSDEYELLTANKIFVEQGFSIKQCFKDVARNVFQSGIESVNFADSTNTANKINQWVANQTNSKINNLISPNSINELTRLVLVNTLYFLGKWQTQFNTHYTTDQSFFTQQNKSVLVKTMHRTGEISVATDSQLKATFINLPYNGPNISMTIILPNNINGLNQLETNIKQILERKPNYLKTMYKFALPTFHIEASYNLNSALKNIGLKSAFTNDANFSGFGNNEQLSISSVIQKTFVNVTENGTEAAAASAVIVGTTSVIIAPDLLVDRPFLFYISIKDLILFLGRVVNPNN